MALGDKFAKKEIIYGPVAAGKTHEFIRRITTVEHFAKKFNYKIILFQPESNKRGATSILEEAPLEIFSRTGLKYASNVIKVHNSQDILDYFLRTRKPDQKTLVGIDEAQFLDSRTPDVAEKLRQRDCRVIMVGVDKSFRGTPMKFTVDYQKTMADLIASVPEEGRHHLTAYCDVCGNTAEYSQRVNDGKPAPYYEILLKAGYGYEARCAEHFETPGKDEYDFVKLVLQRNSGTTIDNITEIARTIGHVEPDITTHIINTLCEECEAFKEEGKIYVPKIIVPTTQIPLLKS